MVKYRTAIVELGFFLPDADALKIFVLGSFGDFEARERPSKRALGRLVAGLRDLGWDAFLSGDPRSVEIAGGDLQPLVMTETLEPRCDLAVYVATWTGREAGWASEITRMQTKHPRGANRRLMMLPHEYPLSAILDPAQGGVLANPRVLTSWWSDEDDLLNQVNVYAEYVAQWGQLPHERF
jgi:hypothetical protein